MKSWLSITGICLAAFFSFLFLGCEKGSNGSALSAQPGLIITNSETVAWRDLPASAPLVVVGNHVLTKSELLNCVSNDYHALVARGEKRHAIVDKFEKKRVELAAQHVTRFMQQSVFLMRADELGIGVDERAVAAQWSAISNQAQKASLDLLKFAQVNGHRTLADFDRFIRDNIRFARVFAVTFSNRLDVAQREVDELHAKLEKGNREATATNAVLLAKMKQLRARLATEELPFGENDEENAKKVPEGFKVEWFVKAPGNSFDDEESVVGRVRYQGLKTWSEPFEDDSDYSIYYMKEIEQKSSEAPTLFTGFRVFCEKDHGFLVPTKQQLMSDMRKRRNIEVVTPEFERLCRRYGVIYPNGFVWRDIFK